MNKWYIWAHETKKHLHHKTLRFCQIPYQENNHWHCEICWARFSKHNGDLQKAIMNPTVKVGFARIDIKNSI